MKIAIVLAPGSRFSQSRPNSMETVVRTLAEVSRYRSSIRIFCPEGADDHGDFDVQTVTEGRNVRIEALTRCISDYAPDLIEVHQKVVDATRLARRFPRATHLLYRHHALKPPRPCWIAGDTRCVMGFRMGWCSSANQNATVSSPSIPD